MSNGRGNAGLVERMMTADSSRPTADSPKRAACGLLVACDRQFDYAVCTDADRDVCGSRYGTRRFLGGPPQDRVQT